MILLLLCLLPRAAIFLLTIWPFGSPSPRSPLLWRPHKELCFDWRAGLSTDVFLSIRANVRPLSSEWIPTKLTSSPTSSYSAPASVSTQLQLFLGSPSTALFPFLNMHLRWRPSFSHVSRPYAVSLLHHGAILKSASFFCIKLFFGLFSPTLHPDGFLSWALPISPNWNASTERPVAPSLAASRLPLSLCFSPRLLYLPYESPWPILPCHLMSGLFVSQPPFLFQVWPDSEWNQDSADRPGKLLRPLIHSYLLLYFQGRLFLLPLPFLLEICLPSLWIPPFPIHALAPIPLFLAKVWLSPTLTLSSFTIWYSGQTALFLILLAKAAPAYLPTAFSLTQRPLFPFRQAQYV